MKRKVKGRRKIWHKAPACANCDAELVGAYCHACGQKAHLHNRLKDVLEEFAEGIIHFDGRIWRTLPLLALRPGRLSREWISSILRTVGLTVLTFLGFAGFLLGVVVLGLTR